MSNYALEVVLKCFVFLGKKLIDPLTNLIHSTSAMSLLYECINTVIAVLVSISSGMPNHPASIQVRYLAYVVYRRFGLEYSNWRDLVFWKGLVNTGYAVGNRRAILALSSSNFHEHRLAHESASYSMTI